MAKAKKQTKVQEEKKDFKSNVIQFSSVQKTRNGGLAVWVGPNVIFINAGLLAYLNKQKAS